MTENTQPTAPNPNAIAVKKDFALAPKNADQLYTMAHNLSTSGAVPKAYEGNAGAVMAAIQHGAEVGFGPANALQTIAVVNGRPCIWGDGLPALAESTGDVEWTKEHWEANGEECPEPQYTKDKAPDSLCYCWQTKRKSHTEPSKVVRFSVNDAKETDVWTKRGPWSQGSWKRMLMMRCRGFGFRDYYPDALRGLAIREEVEDMAPSGGGIKVVQDDILAQPTEFPIEAEEIMDAEIVEPEPVRITKEQTIAGIDKRLAEKKSAWLENGCSGADFYDEAAKNLSDELGHEATHEEILEALTNHRFDFDTADLMPMETTPEEPTL